MGRQNGLVRRHAGRGRHLDRPPHRQVLREDARGLPRTGTTATPSYAEVLEVRAGRVALVRDLLATVTPDTPASTRPNPHNPASPLRRNRPLDAIEATPDE
ncbi:hypothetical protein [Jiangella asiatica]|uniref:hypothetical protein n=1 Tax=Jiangella asiatica TaxID=2530372 RepID=UPI00193DE87D|nr:hypothetical protein [Jiangella asiatica]